MRAPLIVTTGEGARELHRERAAVLAARFSCPYVARARADNAFAVDVDAAGGADLVYVVHRDKEELVHHDGRRTHVQPGLLPTKLKQGEAHPFIRALRGGSDEAVDVVFDATLGLANDAIHAAAATGATVFGAEASRLMHALLEGGLPRLAMRKETWASAASRIHAAFGDSEDVLAARASDSVDVVVIDPMMSRARKNAPAFDLVRAVAKLDRASPRLLREAVRVARRRVLLKLGKGAPLPVSRPCEFGRVFDGAHVSYWLHDKGSDAVFGDDGDRSSHHRDEAKRGTP